MKIEGTGEVNPSYEDVEKHCNKTGYYIGEYWFPKAMTLTMIIPIKD